jgi:hypothetical protein
MGLICRQALAGAALLLALGACGDREGSVGEFSNDLLGNEIMIEALHKHDCTDAGGSRGRAGALAARKIEHVKRRDREA